PFERRTPFLMTGIVESDVEPTIATERRPDEAFDIVLPRHIGPHTERLCAQSVASRRRCVDLGFTPAGNHDRGRALLRHPERGGPADAAPAARDQADFSLHALAGRVMRTVFRQGLTHRAELLRPQPAAALPGN